MKHLQTFSFLVLIAVLSYVSAFDNETRKDEYQLQNLKQYSYNFNFCPTLYGRYPHPRDCSMFWECRNGQPFLLQCVQGKLYDATRGLCREKHLVECKLDREVKDRDGKDEDKDNWNKNKDKDVTLNFKCPYNWGFFEHPYDCSKFLACKKDVPLVTDCPRGTLWDDREKGCVDWRYVKCGNRWDKYRKLITTKKPFQPPTTPFQPTTRDVTLNFKCPYNWGFFEHPYDCSKFFACKGDVPQVTDCPRGTLWDDNDKGCVDWRYVKCGNRWDKYRRLSTTRKPFQPPTTPFVPTTKDVKVNFKCPYVWGFFPHPYDCSKFFACKYDIPILTECPKGFLWDIKDKACVEWRWVNCGNRINKYRITTTPRPITDAYTTTQPTTTTTELTTTEVPPTKGTGCLFPDGKFPDLTNCSLYYECRNSYPTLRQCPEGTLYDERKEECRDAKLVRCGERPGGVNGDDELEEIKKKKEEYQCPYVWGLFPHPDDCAKYIICIYNVPTVFSCKKTELYHAYYRRCLPKEYVECDYRINPDDLLPPGWTTLPPTTTTTPIPTTTSTTPIPTTTTTTPIPTTTTTTPIPTTTTTTPIPTTTTTTPIPTTTTTTPIPTTTTTTPIPTTTTTTPIPTTTTTTPIPTTTTTTPIPTTTTTTPIPTTTTTTPIPTTTTTTPIPTTTTTTPIPTTTTTTPIPTTTETTQVTKPNTPPPTDCDEDDLDCIIDDTGDVTGWFDCPKRYGHFPHDSSHQLFIHCDNWRPFVKKCADHTVFSPKYLVCMWKKQPGDMSDD